MANNLNLNMIASFKDRASAGLKKLETGLDRVKRKADKAAASTSRVGRGGGRSSGGGRGGSGGGGGSTALGVAAGAGAGSFFGSREIKNPFGPWLTFKWGSLTNDVSKFGKAMDGVNIIMRHVGVAWAGAAAAFAVTSLAIGIAGKKYETMRATLSSVLPAQVSTAEGFALIQRITEQLPTDLEQTSQAFIKMLALGIVPTEERMLSFGNTAAAMGKDIMQFTEAVADAATNEFERLKEFGIKTKSEGDKVSFTFQGLTTTVGKNSKEIVAYLESIGNVQFAGAAAKQMDTVEGKLSNLGVAWGKFIDFLNEQGAKNATKSILDAVTSAVDGLRTLVVWIKNAGVHMSAFTSKVGEDLKLIGKLAAVAFTDDTVEGLIAAHTKAIATYSAIEDAMIAENYALLNIDDSADKANAALKKLDKTQKSNVISMKGFAVEAHKLQTIDDLMNDLANNFADTERGIENAWEAQEQLNEMFQEGIISSDEFLHSMEAVNAMLIEDTDETTDKVAGFWQQAANNMQDTMGNFFFDVMQGNMTNLADSFKRMIDRMVAELLASKLLNFLVGDYGSTGSVGGAIGDMFRAEGGPVTAGRPYIVGEEGPELMVPNSSGSVVSNKQLNSMGGGGNVSISISALDGADAMRVMESNRREIAEMVFGTAATYNLGTA